MADCTGGMPVSAKRSRIALFLLIIATFSAQPASLKAGIILWAWDRHEDLGFLDTLPADRNFSVAFFAGTIDLKKNAPRFIPRQRKLLVGKSIPLIPVLHVVSQRGKIYGEEDLDLIVRSVNNILKTHGGKIIQLDFEVFESQRRFYRELILDIRKKLPDIRLSVTALASWCTGDAWLKGIPIDEIVPMYFDATHGRDEATRPGAGIAGECTATAGLATYEKYEAMPHATRYYLFNNRAWHRDALLRMLEVIDHAKNY